MDSPIDFNRAWRFIQDRWSTGTGLIAAVAAVGLASTLTFAQFDLAEISPVEFALIILFCFVTALYWRLSRVPRAAKNRIGFGFAMAFESSAHAQTVESDLVVTLRDLINASQLQKKFEFIKFSGSVANSLTDLDAARRLAQQSNLRFLVWGRARLRTQASGETHVIDMRCLVRHVSIEPEQRKQFAKELDEVMPRRLVLPTQGDTFMFEVAAVHLDAAARYIIATAAAFAGDFHYSEGLLLAAEERLTGHVSRAEGTLASVLLDRVKTRLGDLYDAWLNGLAEQHVATRDVQLLNDHEEIIEKLRRYRRDDYGTHLAAALAAFSLRRDVQAAKREVAACSGSGDAAWRYSEAFLLAYEGDLDNAYRSYRRAFESPLNNASIPTQCEEFIHNVIEQEPHRNWLFFCLGLINHRGKGDLQAARADFQRFVEAADQNQFHRHVAIARTWLSEIDAALRV